MRTIDHKKALLILSALASGCGDLEVGKLEQSIVIRDWSERYETVNGLKFGPNGEEVDEVRCDSTPRPFYIAKYYQSSSGHVARDEHSRRGYDPEILNPTNTSDWIEACSQTHGLSSVSLACWDNWHHSVYYRFRFIGRCVPAKDPIGKAACKAKVDIEDNQGWKAWESCADDRGGGHKHSGHSWYSGCEHESGKRRLGCALKPSASVTAWPDRHEAPKGDSVAFGFGHATHHSDSDPDAPVFSLGLAVQGAFAVLSPGPGGSYEYSDTQGYVLDFECQPDIPAQVRGGEPVAGVPRIVTWKPKAAGEDAGAVQGASSSGGTADAEDKWPRWARDEVNAGAWEGRPGPLTERHSCGD